MTATDDKIRTLFAQCLARGQAQAKDFRAQADINESYVAGRQFGSVQYGADTTVYKPFDWADGLPRYTMNVCRGTMQVWAAYLSKARVTATAYPASDDPEDVYRAELANHLIKFTITEDKTAELIGHVVQQACVAGTAGLRLEYDADADKITWTPQTIWDFYIDNTAAPAERRWVIFVKHVDEEAALDLVERFAADKDYKPAEEPYKQANGVAADGVVVHEFYHRPTRDFPRGLYALFVGGELIHSLDFPYVVENDSTKPEYLLPLVLMRVRTVRGLAYGETNLSDVIGQQRLINEMLNRELAHLRRTAGVKVVAPNGVSEGWKAGEDQVFSYSTTDPSGGRGIQIMQVPEPPQSYARLRAEAEAAIPAIIGLNDQSAGVTNRTYSGKALELIDQQDASKNADAQRSLENMVLDAYRLFFALVTRFYSTARQMKLGDADKATVVSFRGADVQGVDLRLEPGSELDKRDDVETATAKQALEQGVGTKLDVEKAEHTAGYTMSRRISRQIIAQYLAGHTLPDPRPGVDFDIDVFHEELARAKANALGNKPDWLALHALGQLIDSLAEKHADTPPPLAEQAAPQPGAAPAPVASSPTPAVPTTVPGGLPA